MRGITPAPGSCHCPLAVGVRDQPTALHQLGLACPGSVWFGSTGASLMGRTWGHPTLQEPPLALRESLGEVRETRELTASVVR